MDSLDGLSHSVIIEEAIGSVEQEVSQHNSINYEHLEDSIVTDDKLLMDHELVVGSDASIHNSEGILDTIIMNPDEEISLDGSLPLALPETEDSSPSTKKIKGSKKWRRKFGVNDGKGSEAGKTSTVRSWQQKRVQIKTLEGAFSVTMWASGRECFIVLLTDTMF